MKVIAYIGTPGYSAYQGTQHPGLFVEMSVGELRLITGQTPDRDELPKLGAQFDVWKAWRFILEVKEQREKVASIQSTLRAMADLLDAVPKVVEEPEGGAA